MIAIRLLTLFRLKCNREKPCQNCIVRGEGTPNSCTYAEKAEGRNGKSNPRADAEDMRKRINRLESSILSMMSSDSREGPPLHNITSHVTNSPHIQGELLEPDEEHVTSVDSRSTHWDVILNDVSYYSSGSQSNKPWLIHISLAQ
jgi:hypothetical protein